MGNNLMQNLNRVCRYDQIPGKHTSYATTKIIINTNEKGKAPSLWQQRILWKKQIPPDIKTKCFWQWYHDKKKAKMPVKTFVPGGLR